MRTESTVTGSRATRGSTQQQLCPQRVFVFLSRSISASVHLKMKQQGPVQDQQAFPVLDQIPTEVPDQHKQVPRGPTFHQTLPE